MAWLLRILQGPNAGAEIALPASGRVRLGAADACDLLLADPTLPSEALELDVSESAVSATFLEAGGALAGEPREKGATVTLDPFAVVAFGATRLAVGPEGSPWPEIEIPQIKAKSEEKKPEEESKKEAAPAADAPAPASAPTDAPKEPEGEDRGFRGSAAYWTAAAVLALLVFGVAWFLARRGLAPASGKEGEPSAVSVETRSADAASAALVAFAKKSGLRLEPDPAGGAPRLVGNFATRAERRAAAAGAREADPAVRLALSDDETLRACSEELLAAISGGRLQVDTATNRVVRLVGRAASPEALSATVAALCADVPHVETVETDAVGLDSVFSGAPSGATTYRPLVASPAAAARARTADLPVAGIMLTPYRCLVLRDGSRASEGAVIGGFTVEKIDATEVTLRRGKETLAWHP